MSEVIKRYKIWEKCPWVEVSIYALSDPRICDLYRYIGATKKTLHERLLGHLSTSRSGASTPLYEWIRSLTAIGLRPEITLIEKTNGSRAESDEQFFIDRCRKNGVLLNSEKPSFYRNTWEWVDEGHPDFAKIPAKVQTLYR